MIFKAETKETTYRKAESFGKICDGLIFFLISLRRVTKVENYTENVIGLRASLARVRLASYTHRSEPSEG